MSATSHSQFRLAFLHPRNALTWLVFLLARVGTWLPRRWTLFLGRKVGQQFYRRNRKRREIVMINLRLCFPELNPHELERLCQRHFELYGMTIIDLGLVWWGSEAKLKRLVTVRGMERVDRILEAGGQVLFVSPHAMAIDLGGIYLSSRIPLTSMMKRAPDAILNWLLLLGRNRFGGTMVMRDEGIRALIRQMRSGRSCYLIPDEDLGEKGSQFVPFFGVERATLSVVGRLAAITRAAVMPIYTVLDDRTGMYKVHIGEPLTDFPSGDDYEDTRRVSQAMEQSIRIAPEQYMWTLRWFKTRPHGQPSPYEHLK